MILGTSGSGAAGSEGASVHASSRDQLSGWECGFPAVLVSFKHRCLSCCVPFVCVSCLCFWCRIQSTTAESSAEEPVREPVGAGSCHQMQPDRRRAESSCGPETRVARTLGGAALLGQHQSPSPGRGRGCSRGSPRVDCGPWGRAACHSQAQAGSDPQGEPRADAEQESDRSCSLGGLGPPGPPAHVWKPWSQHLRMRLCSETRPLGGTRVNGGRECGSQPVRPVTL